MKKTVILLAVILASKFAVAQEKPMPASDAILKSAYAQAAKENKKVMLIFHA